MRRARDYTNRHFDELLNVQILIPRSDIKAADHAVNLASTERTQQSRVRAVLNLHRKARRGFAERQQRARKYRRFCYRQHPDAYASNRAPSNRQDLALCAFEIIEHELRSVHQRAAAFRRRNASLAPNEQQRTKNSFQLADELADSGLGQANIARSVLHAARLRDSEKNLQVACLESEGHGNLFQ
jgi:hypothetical protein